MLAKSHRVVAIIGFMALVGVGSEGADNAPIVVVFDRVVYHAEHDQGGAEASVKAVAPDPSTLPWRVLLDQEAFLLGESKAAKPRRIAAMEPFGRGLVAKTNDGATFFIDPATRKAELVRDLRASAAKCPVHHGPMVGLVVPIHYGMATARPLSREQRERYPLADRPYEGGCCVMPEKAALRTACPECGKGDR